jgi:hypothetical protein
MEFWAGLLISIIGTIITLIVCAALSITVIWWVVLIVWLVLVFLGVLVLDGDFDLN